MAIPILYGLGAAALFLLSGFGGYVARHDIAAFFKKRPMVILGAHRVGKTVLIRYLTEGRLNAEGEKYVRTEAARDMGKGRHVIDNDDPNIYVKSIHDVPGAEDDVGTWKDLFLSASKDARSLCLYLVDAQRLHDGDEEHVDRVRMDIDRICGWINGTSGQTQPLRSPRVLVIATHIDLVPGWKGGSEEVKARIEKGVRTHDALQQINERRDEIGSHVMVADLSGHKDGFVRLLDGICGTLGAKEKK